MPQSISNRAPASVSPAGRLRPGFRQHLALGLLLLMLAAAGAGWWLTSRAPPVQYTTAPVTRGDIVKGVTATGTVNPVLTIIVGTYVSGVIQELFCDYNTRVKKGQICAKIDPRPYQTVVDQDRANLAVAKAQLVKDQASLAYAKLNWDRNGTLAAHGWVSQDTADSAKSTYDQAQAQTEVDRATIAQRQAELATAQVNLGYTDIVSPVDGTVVSRNVTMGQTVAASFQTPTLFLIATDLTQMEVDTNVSESDVGAVKEGDKATFTVESFPSRTFSGKVVQVRQAPQSIQNVVTYDVVIGVPNTDLSLMPGMTATTRITTQERHNVLRAPDQALRYTPGGLAAARPAPGAPSATGRPGQVWVLRDGHPVRVPVALGLDDDSFTEIVSGDLTAGEPVIVSEQQGAAGGTRPTAPPPLRL
jgi:HlyD family secretion protein